MKFILKCDREFRPVQRVYSYSELKVGQSIKMTKKANWSDWSVRRLKTVTEFGFKAYALGYSFPVPELELKTVGVYSWAERLKRSEDPDIGCRSPMNLFDNYVVEIVQ